MTDPRVVVVFGGGGAKAAAHAGAHRAMDEASIEPDHYVGTSMGAVLAAMFAAGLGPREVLARVTSIGIKDVASPDRFAVFKGLWLRALLRPGPLRATLERLLPARRFEDLKLPLTVTTTALDSGELVLFGARGRHAPLIDALYASCALPLYYPPAMIEGRPYGDGGLRSVLPIGVAAELHPELVVAVDVGPGFDEAPASGKPSGGLPPVVQIHGDATGIMMAANTALELALWRATPGRPALVHIRPRVEKGATFRVDQLAKYEEEGYRAAQTALAGLRLDAG